jgi:hypothetical protein
MPKTAWMNREVVQTAKILLVFRSSIVHHAVAVGSRSVLRAVHEVSNGVGASPVSRCCSTKVRRPDDVEEKSARESVWKRDFHGSRCRRYLRDRAARCLAAAAVAVRTRVSFTIQDRWIAIQSWKVDFNREGTLRWKPAPVSRIPPFPFPPSWCGYWLSPSGALSASFRFLGDFGAEFQSQ